MIYLVFDIMQDATRHIHRCTVSCHAKRNPIARGPGTDEPESPARLYRSLPPRHRPGAPGRRMGRRTAGAPSRRTWTDKITALSCAFPLPAFPAVPQQRHEAEPLRPAPKAIGIGCVRRSRPSIASNRDAFLVRSRPGPGGCSG